MHVATGASDGKDGLFATEMDATNRIPASAIAHGTRRVVLDFSNHASGWPERDWLAEEDDGHVRPRDPQRQSGLYGVEKVYAEALGRSASQRAAHRDGARSYDAARSHRLRRDATPGSTSLERNGSDAPSSLMTT